MAAAALAALPAIAETGFQAASAAGIGSELYDKYKPKVKGVANHVFSKRKRKSALGYIKKLGTVRGMKKFVTKDAMKAAKGASKYISSGKLLKTVSGVADDARMLTDAARPLMGDEMHHSITSKIGQGQDKISHFHQLAENYNEQGKGLHDSFKDALKPKM